MDYISYPTLGLYVSHIFLYKIYSLYYTMGYVINLLSAYNIYRYIGHIVHMEYIVTPHWVYMYPIYFI